MRRVDFRSFSLLRTQLVKLLVDAETSWTNVIPERNSLAHVGFLMQQSGHLDTLHLDTAPIQK